MASTLWCCAQQKPQSTAMSGTVRSPLSGGPHAIGGGGGASVTKGEAVTKRLQVLGVVDEPSYLQMALVWGGGGGGARGDPCPLLRGSPSLDLSPTACCFPRVRCWGHTLEGDGPP